MLYRFIGLALSGALLAGSGVGAQSSTLSTFAPAADALHAARAKPARIDIAFDIALPAKSQRPQNEPLAKLAAATRSASFTVGIGDRAPAATTAIVDCATACAGSISAPLGSGTFVAKLFSGNRGAGRLLATGTATQLIGAQTKAVRFTFNPVVATVGLALKDTIIPASSAGATTQLLISARDPSGAVIIGPGTYVDQHGKPLTIVIANSSPTNTALVPSSFTKPLPSQGVSNVASVTYKGRAHFHYPTFTVANRGLPALPSRGVTLTYLPGSGDSFDDSLANCINSFPSVGGNYYGGPFFAFSSSACPLPWYADALQLIRSTSTYVTYAVNPNHDSPVTLGFGSDKKVYFAYDSPADGPGTVFGYLRPVAPTMAKAASQFRLRGGGSRFMRGNVATRRLTSANITSVSALTLGNDGSLWFNGVWNGQATIGKLPPAGLRNWPAQLYSVPGAVSVFSIEPGIGNTEALLYSAVDGIYVGTIGTDFSAFHSVRVFTTTANPGFGDLIAGPDGDFYLSAPDGGPYDTVYRLTSSGAVSAYCPNVQQVYRLSDGTGVAFLRDDLTTGYHSIVHVLPGQGCTTVPVFPLEPSGTFPFFDFLGVDSTTEDWLFYSNPSGHRVGIF